MKITKENLSDLELRIKIDIEENDYSDAVAKELKSYQRQATVPGFRKGMAPMGLIERMYKTAIVADAVQNKLNTEIFNYIDSEKLRVLGSPMSDDELTGSVDFAHQKDYTFYFTIATEPQFEIEWDKIKVPYNQIKVTAKDVDAQVQNICRSYGKFETPETICKNAFVYGTLVELDKKGEPKQDGVNSSAYLRLDLLKDEEMLPTFEGKKIDDKIIFNLYKAFPVSEIERMLNMDNATAKKFKADVQFTVSGISLMVEHPLDAELFEKMFPGKGISDADAFRKAVQKDIEQNNSTQSDYLYVNQVRKALIENFSAPLPEAFLKRWFASRGEKDLTPEYIEQNWAENYLPSLKWELIENKLEQIQPVLATNNQLVDRIKDILRKNDPVNNNESADERENRLEQAARSIAADRNNVMQISDQIYADNLAKLFKEQLKPEIEKVSAKEFGERAKL